MSVIWQRYRLCGGFIYLRARAMNNFDLHTPTRILFGKGAIENLRDQIPADARVLSPTAAAA
jgi:NADP-dependent alcohol dehydrogenase